MALSDSYSFTFTLNGLITAAFQLINVYEAEDTVSAKDYNVALVLLNSMIKGWETKGIKLWKRRQATLFTDYNINNYQLGLTGDNVTNTYKTTTITTNAALSATTLHVGSTVGMSVGDNIGITLDDLSREWTTITSITNSTTLVVTDAITDTATIGNTIVTYTTKINRPLKITRATSYDLISRSENQIAMISYDEYFDLPSKITPGRPNNAYYDKLLGNGVLYLYTQPNNVNILINFTYYDSIMDMVNMNDNFDFPQEWYDTVLYNLATRLCYPYQKFIELTLYKAIATELEAAAKQWDGDEEPLHLKVNTRRGR